MEKRIQQWPDSQTEQFLKHRSPNFVDCIVLMIARPINTHTHVLLHAAEAASWPQRWRAFALRSSCPASDQTRGRPGSGRGYFLPVERQSKMSLLSQMVKKRLCQAPFPHTLAEWGEPWGHGWGRIPQMHGAQASKRPCGRPLPQDPP